MYSVLSSVSVHIHTLVELHVRKVYVRAWYGHYVITPFEATFTLSQSASPYLITAAPTPQLQVYIPMNK